MNEKPVITYINNINSRKAGGVNMNSSYTEINNINKAMFFTGCFPDEPQFKCVLCEQVVSLDDSVSNRGSNLICTRCFRLYFNGELKNFEKWAKIKTYRFSYTVNGSLKNAQVKSDSLENAVSSLARVFELKKDDFNLQI